MVLVPANKITRSEQTLIASQSRHSATLTAAVCRKKRGMEMPSFTFYFSLLFLSYSFFGVCCVYVCTLTDETQLEGIQRGVQALANHGWYPSCCEQLQGLILKRKERGKNGLAPYTRHPFFSDLVTTSLLCTHTHIHTYILSPFLFLFFILHSLSLSLHSFIHHQAEVIHLTLVFHTPSPEVDSISPHS